MNEMNSERKNIIRVSSVQAFFLFVQAVFFERDVDLRKYNREYIQACLDLEKAYRAMYEAAVGYVIELFSDAVNMAISLWMDKDENSYGKTAKDVYIQRLSFELPDKLDSLFEKLTEESVAAVDRHFQDLQIRAGFTPVPFETLDLSIYRQEWEGVFLQHATDVVINRIDMMKLDKRLTAGSGSSDRFMETVTKMFERTDLECIRIRDRLTVRLKGFKPFSVFSSAVSKNVLAWVSCIEEDDECEF